MYFTASPSSVPDSHFINEESEVQRKKFTKPRIKLSAGSFF